MKALTPTVRKLLAHAVLGFVLLFAQQHSVQHWLAHAMEAAALAKAKGTVDDGPCLECDSLAAFSGGFLPGAELALAATAEPGETLCLAPEASRCLAVLATAYQPRAPPAGA